MKPVINVAVALLLSLGLVACGGGGGGTSNNNAAAVNPNQNSTLSDTTKDKNHIDYIELEDNAQKTITLTETTNSKYEETKKYSHLLATSPNGKNLLIEGKSKQDTPLDHKEQLMTLNAKYEGTVLVALHEGNNKSQIEKRNVLFNLKQNKISGHSIKSKTADDLQIRFQETNIDELMKGDEKYLGFQGKATIQKAQQSFPQLEYFGEFAGQHGEEIAGYFVDVEHKTPETQPKVSGGFIATREMKAESTATPKQ
ncbi:hypothetical protein [Pasteurella sp. PK-2025]|uniref:hypothetical protein n=1 Tax=Pasteurella sp. PK-2025 TaxID=3413133 RepID=UPI003C77EC6B